MRALVLAAGLGTRLLPFSARRPKPLFTLCRRPLLDWILERLGCAGCTAALVNTHHLAGAIDAFVASRRYPMPVTVRHEPQILGTAGAVRNLADLWHDGPLLVINGDVLCDIDLAALWRAHRADDAAATLVLHDRPPFNHVTLGAQGRIAGFHLPPAGRGEQRLAFTGIQVLSPRVLPHIPAAGPACLIDLYRALIAAGDPPRARLVSGHFWQDMGTPERYRALAADSLAAEAFGRPWPSAEGGSAIAREPLAGDGSARLWSRLRCGDKTLVLADHGIHGPEAPGEADAFVAIGGHLARCGVPVPRIVTHDTFSGLVILEDLGSRHLLQAAAEAGGGDGLLDLYRPVIDRVLAMNRAAGPGFDPAWAYQGAVYDRRLILERECRYFLDAFAAIRGCDPAREAQHLAGEFERLAERIAELAPSRGFMHRDCQSRNIMLRGGEAVFIDFQGGRVGPVEYDLASLIADPYVDLPEPIQRALVDYAAEAGGPPEKLRQAFAWCAVARGMQALGAFGRLSRLPGKGHFGRHIPAGLRQLRRSLGRLGAEELPRLRALVHGLQG